MNQANCYLTDGGIDKESEWPTVSPEDVELKAQHDIQWPNTMCWRNSIRKHLGAERMDEASS